MGVGVQTHIVYKERTIIDRVNSHPRMKNAERTKRRTYQPLFHFALTEKPTILCWLHAWAGRRPPVPIYTGGVSWASARRLLNIGLSSADQPRPNDRVASASNPELQFDRGMGCDWSEIASHTAAHNHHNPSNGATYAHRQRLAQTIYARFSAFLRVRCLCCESSLQRTSSTDRRPSCLHTTSPSPAGRI